MCVCTLCTCLAYVYNTSFERQFTCKHIVAKNTFHNKLLLLVFVSNIKLEIASPKTVFSFSRITKYYQTFRQCATGFIDVWPSWSRWCVIFKNWILKGKIKFQNILIWDVSEYFAKEISHLLEFKMCSRL